MVVKFAPYFNVQQINRSQNVEWIKYLQKFFFHYSIKIKSIKLIMQTNYFYCVQSFFCAKFYVLCLLRLTKQMVSCVLGKYNGESGVGIDYCTSISFTWRESVCTTVHHLAYSVVCIWHWSRQTVWFEKINFLSFDNWQFLSLAYGLWNMSKAIKIHG